MKQFLEIGEIVTTHGVAGELKVYPWSDSAEALKKVRTVSFSESGAPAVKVLGVRSVGNMCLLQLEGVESVEQARRYIGRVLFAPRAELALPKGRYFIADLLGCSVVDADSGAVYGTLCDVTDNGAHGIYHVRMTSGEVRLMPAVEPFLAGAQPEQGRILVRPIRGMFDDAD